jgi:hypothetical protein
MQIRRFTGYWDRRKQKPLSSANDDPMRAPNPGMYGLGLILGGAAACFGRECGAGMAQLLAIYDDDRQHAVLVRYYKALGFGPLREVGDSLASLGDRVVSCLTSMIPSVFLSLDVGN